jgi:hypothetical protein
VAVSVSSHNNLKSAKMNWFHFFVLLFSLLSPLYSKTFSKKVFKSFCFRVNNFVLDYYWRDYFGEIPDDAVPGGTDRNHEMTYIAQVYIPKQGILTTRLYKGSKSVTASRYGIHTSDVFVKILCSNQPEKLSWVPATAAKLHTELAGKHLVAGGTENGKTLNIGRVSYQGEVIVGKVCSYNVGNALMFFPYHNNEISVKSYEVLVYDNKDVA